MFLATTPKNGQHIEKIHRGIVCDGCKENPIQGKRYKCIECLDFDLCYNCRHSGIHDNHQMELIKVNSKLFKISINHELVIFYFFVDST